VLELAYDVVILLWGVQLIAIGWVIFSYALWGLYDVLDRLVVWLFTRRLEVAHD
jgi:hypothetical protein